MGGRGDEGGERGGEEGWTNFIGVFGGDGRLSGD